MVIALAPAQGAYVVYGCWVKELVYFYCFHDHGVESTSATQTMCAKKQQT